MFKGARVILTVLSFLYIASAQTKTSVAPTNAQNAASASDSSARLPIKRVVLYKNGVGYFEHSARAHGNQDLTIDFTTAQLNDVLKSLTAVDLGDGRISSVRYNSIAPLDERLKALRLPFGEQVSRADFLSALRGARVDVRSGSASASGRLLSVEKERRSNGKGDYYDATEFSIVSDSGEMRSFELGPGTSVRLAERDLSDEVGRYFNLIGSSRARDLRRMTLAATGTGDREIFVSYISEVPIWKSTYRIILPAKPNEKPILQGWAIVDNTVGEDWKDVQLSLIAGSPQSFVENISQPYYVRRPVVEPPPSVMLTPQAHEGTVSGGVGPGLGGGIGGGTFASGTGAVAGIVTDPSGAVIAGAQVTLRNQQTGALQSTTSDARGTYSFYGLSPGRYSVSIEVRGFRTTMMNATVVSGEVARSDATVQLGSTNEMVAVEAGAAQVQTEEATVEAAISNQHIEAEGKDLGDYFEYNLRQKITIGKNQSALVPILQARVDAEKVSLWNEESKEIRRALWLSNSSGQTLDSGTFNIVDKDTFAGEGLIETVHPAERRLISYAADTALRITMDEEGSQKPVNRVRIAKGVMILTREQREQRKYTLHNSDSEARQVVIEHPAREGWKLAEGAKAEETTASFLRFRVGVGPGQTETLAIEEYQPQETTYELTDLEDQQVNQINALIAENHVTPALQKALRAILDQKNLVDGYDGQIKSRQGAVDSITKDQARLRENMKALKGTPEEKALLQRYTKQLDSQEDQLASLQKEIADLNAKRDKANEDLDQMVQNTVLDESF